MSHPSDRRSDGPADRRFERMPDRSPERSGQRRPEGPGGSPSAGRPVDRRRVGPQDRPLAAAGSSRWGAAGVRGRRPGGVASGERPAGSGARDVTRPDRGGPGLAARRSFRDAPGRAARGDFAPPGERRGSFAERRGSFAERRGSFAERRGSFAERRGSFAERPGVMRDRGPAERPGEDRGSEPRGGERRGGEQRGGGERWPAAAPGRFPGSRRPDRPARPRLPLRAQPGRPALVGAPAAGLAEFETESHAPAAPADLIWGRHSALAALEAGRPLHRIWCTSELRFSPKFLQLLRDAKASGVLLEEVTWARLGQISGGAVHQGIVLQPAAAATLQLEALIEGCRKLGESPLLIAVDGLTDPQNLGAIVRSAEALGAHGLVLPQRRNAGLTGSVAKVAAGALEHLPVARVVNLNRSLDALKQEGYRVIGLAAEGTVTLEEADLSGPLVLVTGSEADGLSLLTRRSCDQLVRIPLRGTTPSLNASVATALLVYEVARRSWMAGLRGTAPAPRLERPALPELEPIVAAAAEPEAANPQAEAGPDEGTELASGSAAGEDTELVSGFAAGEASPTAADRAAAAAADDDAAEDQNLNPAAPPELAALGEPALVPQPPALSAASQPSWEAVDAAAAEPNAEAMSPALTAAPQAPPEAVDDPATAGMTAASETSFQPSGPADTTDASATAPPVADTTAAAATALPDAAATAAAAATTLVASTPAATTPAATAPAAWSIAEQCADAGAGEGDDTDPLALTSPQAPADLQTSASALAAAASAFDQDVSL